MNPAAEKKYSPDTDQGSASTYDKITTWRVLNIRPRRQRCLLSKITGTDEPLVLTKALCRVSDCSYTSALLIQLLKISEAGLPAGACVLEEPLKTLSGEQILCRDGARLSPPYQSLGFS